MKTTWMFVCAFVLCAVVSSRAAEQTPAPFALDRIDQRPDVTSTPGSYVYTSTGDGTTIYVVDTGVNAKGDLEGRMILKKKFIGMWRRVREQHGHLDTDDYYMAACGDHGTRVASVAAGATYGPARGAKIVDLRVGACLDGVSQAMHWPDIVDALREIEATHPSNERGVVNLSLNIENELAAYEGYSIADLGNAIRAVRDRGLVVVIAGGSGPNTCQTVTVPIGAADGGTGIIAVSASDFEDKLGVDAGRIAGTGSCIELFAPSGTLATTHDGTPGIFNGTSCAAGVTSGVAALVLSKYPWLTPAEVEDLLIETSTKGELEELPQNTPNRLLFALLPTIDPPTVCASPNTTKSFTVTHPPESGMTFLWSASAGSVDTGATDRTVTVRTPSPWTTGPIRVSARVKGAADDDVRRGYAFFLPRPTATFGSNRYASVGENVEITIPVTGTPPWDVIWSDGVSTRYQTSPARRSVTAQQSTTYAFAELKDGTGCYGFVNGIMSLVVTNCPATAATISAPAALKASQAATASVPETPGATYQWTVENGTIWNGEGTNSIVYIPACSGTTTLRVTVTASCGRPSEGTATTSIWQPQLTISGGGTIAAGETATVAASFYGTAPWQVTWSDGVRITSILGSAYTYEVAPSASTTYTATFKDKNGCTGAVIGSATVNVQ